jgi:FKBP-type peptidyl-prolyl cis-trans isomerase
MASYLGYGKNAAGIIPANSVLIFDIDLIAVY